MLDWTRNDWSMKMNESSRVEDKKLQDNNNSDISVYDALVNMAQDFNKKYPLVNGHGNMGSIDGDTSAAMRYTEAKLSTIGELMLQDINMDTVDMVSNYEDNLNESLSNLENLRQSLAESYDENILKQQNGEILTTDQQDVIDTYQAIADAMRLIYQYTDPNQWNSMQISDVFATDGIEKTKDELIEMAQAGELTPETISGYKNLNSAIQQSGLFLEDGQTAAEAFVDEIYAAAEAEGELENSIPDIGTASLGISETVDQLNLQVKPAFDALKSAWDEIFTDDGFELASANILEIANTIKSELDNYSELGLTIDYSAFEDFVRILEDTESTEEDVRQGFNELAQSIIEAGVTGLEDFETLKEALADLGVVNNEIVAFEALVNNTVALKEAGLDGQYAQFGMDLFPSDSFGNPFNMTYIKVSGDYIADIESDMGAEQRARATYEHLMDLTDDPDVLGPLSFLRANNPVAASYVNELAALAIV